MKLRYKKIILLVLISTMGIGVITLSISPSHNAKESMKYSHTQDVGSANLITEAVTPVPTILCPTVTPTVAPTPTVFPVYDLVSDGYPNITKLMKTYYKAYRSCNMKELKTLICDPANLPSKKKLKSEVQFFEEFRNIKCYVKKGYADGTYIVFTYYELKITNIKTLVPGLTENYIVTESDGSLKIVYGALDKQTEDYYQARKNDADVKKLKDKTEEKFTKVLKKDKTLKTFYNNLLKIHSKKGKSKK